MSGEQQTHTDDLSHRVWRWVERWFAPLWRLWLCARAYTLALKPSRVPVVLFAVGAYFLVSEQGVDVARSLAEPQANSDAGWQTTWFFAAMLGWSVSLWYWTRSLFRLKLPDVPGDEPAYQWLRTWVPRLLGFAAAASVSVAFYRASTGYAAGQHEEVRELLRSYAFWSAVVAAGFLALVSVRRWLAPLLGAEVAKAREEKYGVSDFLELGKTARFAFYGAIVLSAVLFVAFAAFPNFWAPRIGAAAIVLLAAFGWTTVGSVLDFLGMRLRVPVFSGLLVFAIVFSYWNDNHAVRTLEGGQPAARQNLRDSLDGWLARHEKKAKRKGERIPLFLVNAEGGGIRAAYWTATVLGEIHESNPAFADHLYSISGVSGGSLGAAVYVGLLAQSREEKGLNIKQTARRILSEDFLSPAVAAMLYPDLTQRLLPVPFASLDRAATLEQAWERAWDKHVPRRARLSEPFDNLWKDGQHWTPVLLLNATWVETGKRIITSNLSIAAEKGLEDFVDTEDANAFFAPRSVSLATAAHMSARFTYVSPAGTLIGKKGVHGRVVDGGYFENSGATATLEILDTIGLLKGEKPERWDRVDVYVIHISNEPFDERYPSDSLAGAPDNRNVAPDRWVHEVWSPIAALMNTRSARGYYSRETAAWRAGKDHFFHFGLCRASNNAPLGWVLSRKTGEDMDPKKPGCSTTPLAFDNPKSLEKIGLIFGPPPAKQP